VLQQHKPVLQAATADHQRFTTDPELAQRYSIERLLKSREVEILTSMHRQTIWRKIKAGQFPAPRKMGNINVWPESEIRAWIAGVLNGEAA
jgi:predicted DNA-binding transcriptional regulator AlpA